MSNITSTNIHSFCRICLGKLENHGSTLIMNECMYDVHENQELSLWIAKCLSFDCGTGNDCLPNLVCTQCYQKLQCFYEFREMSTRSMRTLWEILGLPEYGEEENNTLNWLGISTNEDAGRTNNSESEDQDVDEKNLVMRTIMESGQFEPEINIEEQTSQIAQCEEMIEEAVDTLDISSNKTTKKQLVKRPQYVSSKFQCKECKRSYANQENLDAHMRTHQGLMPFQCQKCDSSFNRLYHLRRHMERAHSESLQNESTKQDPEQERNKNMNIKEENDVAGVDDDDDINDSKDEDYIENAKAAEAGEEYKNIDSVVLEGSNYFNEKHTAKPKKAKYTSKMTTGKKKYTATKFIYQCKECNRNHASEEALAGHMRTHQGLLPFACTKCPKCFKRAYRLRAHMISSHTEPSKEFTCNVEGCGKTFHLETSYRSHYRLKHSENASQWIKYMCEECGRAFKNSTALRKHRYTHGPREDYPYHCEQCDKRYSTKWAYKEHQMRHAGIKRFVCPYCGLRKTTGNELKTHINNHTKEKQWQCPLCPSVFNRAANLTRHNRTVHIGLREHVCRYCNDSFAKLETLRHHEMRHTGEKPHECHICQKRFIQLVALKTHMKTHAKYGITPEVPVQPRKQPRQLQMLSAQEEKPPELQHSQ